MAANTFSAVWRIVRVSLSLVVLMVPSFLTLVHASAFQPTCVGTRVGVGTRSGIGAWTRIRIGSACVGRNPRSTVASASRLFATTPSSSPSPSPSHPKRRNIAIVGGGLAGLSTTYHLLERMDHVHITVIDKALPGQGGASSVAGGLLHPFSPKGKLIHLGMEGLHQTNHLLTAAQSHAPNCILRDKIYRIALKPNNVKQLQQTAELHEDFATWLDPLDLYHDLFSHVLHEEDDDDGNHEDKDGNRDVDRNLETEDAFQMLGGIVLENGCRVVHVPSYLDGLWKACLDLSKRKNYSFSQDDPKENQTNASTLDRDAKPDDAAAAASVKVTWSVEDHTDSSTSTDHSEFHWKERLKDFDTVVFSAGSGLFHDSILDHNPNAHANDLPVDLVRGQSIEMTMTLHEDDLENEHDLEHGRRRQSHHPHPTEAILCGKYMAPMPDSNRILIGATHEHKAEPLDPTQVVQELKERSYDLSPYLWDHGRVDQITSGYRVQSQRGAFGRMPIVGRLPRALCGWHENAYVFTGLSARGLIYHGIYGRLLSEAIVVNDERVLLEDYPHVLWWKKEKD